MAAAVHNTVMAQDKFMLSERAIRDLKKLKQEISRLRDRLGRGLITPPRGGVVKYAKITDNDTTSYSAKQVVYDGSGGFSDMTGGLTWTKDGSNQLHNIHQADDISAGEVFPVNYMIDDSGYRWGFEGGNTLDSSVDVVSEIVTDTTNQITFNRKRLNYDFKGGYAQDFTGEDDSAAVLTSDGLWIGIEVNGNWWHLPSPADDTSSPYFWKSFGWDGTNMTVDGTSLTNVEILVDERNHVFAINGTNAPAPTQNYKYEHCSDPSTYGDIIFASDQSSFIEADGECYKYVARTVNPITSPVPTVGGDYTSCADCETASTNELWKDCNTDASVAILTAAHTDVDYAWLCHPIDGTYAPSYNSGTQFGTADNPTVLKQCDNASPTACGDLVGWPASDDFGGTGCDSGSYSDTNWDIRWTDNGVGTITVSGDLNLDLNGTSSLALITNNKWTDFSDDFVVQVNLASVTIPVGGGQSNACGLRVTINSKDYEADIFHTTGETGDEGNVVVLDGVRTDAENTVTSGLMKITRSGSTLTVESGSLSRTATVSGNLESILLLGQAVNTNANFDYDNFSLLKGGSEVRIDPSGASCV